MNPDIPLITSLALSLFLGKTVGVALFSFAGLKFRIASLPAGVDFGQIFGIDLTKLHQPIPVAMSQHV